MDRGDPLGPLTVDSSYYPDCGQTRKQTVNFGIKTLTTIKSSGLRDWYFWSRSRSRSRRKRLITHDHDHDHEENVWSRTIVITITITITAWIYTWTLKILKNLLLFDSAIYKLSLIGSCVKELKSSLRVACILSLLLLTTLKNMKILSNIHSQNVYE